MSMSTYIQAFIPEDSELYQKHRAVLLACMNAVVSLPQETAEYFGSKEAYESLLEEKLTIELKEGTHYKEWRDSSSSGFEIEIKDIPKGVSKLRFANSW